MSEESIVAKSRQLGMQKYTDARLKLRVGVVNDDTVDNSAKAQALASTPEWKLEQRRAELAGKRGSGRSYICCRTCKSFKGTFIKATNTFICGRPGCRNNPNSEAKSEH